MATLSFQCLPRWLPPPPISVMCSGYGEPPQVTGVVFPVLPSQESLVKFFILTNSNEWGKRMSFSGREGLNVMKRRVVAQSGTGQYLSPPFFFPLLESYSITGSEGSISASAASGLAAPSGPSSGRCSPAPLGHPVSGLRRWLDHSKHCLSVESEADSGQTGPYEVSREYHRSMG